MPDDDERVIGHLGDGGRDQRRVVASAASVRGRRRGAEAGEVEGNRRHASLCQLSGDRREVPSGARPAVQPQHLDYAFTEAFAKEGRVGVTAEHDHQVSEGSATPRTTSRTTGSVVTTMRTSRPFRICCSSV